LEVLNTYITKWIDLSKFLTFLKGIEAMNKFYDSFNQDIKINHGPPISWYIVSLNNNNRHEIFPPDITQQFISQATNAYILQAQSQLPNVKASKPSVVSNGKLANAAFERQAIDYKDFDQILKKKTNFFLNYCAKMLSHSTMTHWSSATQH
jgi:hypothetical protein